MYKTQFNMDIYGKGRGANINYTNISVPEFNAKHVHTCVGFSENDKNE